MRNNAILFEWCLGDVGVKKTKLMGIQTKDNTDITILSLLFFRLIFFKKTSKFFEFLTEYTGSGFSLEWHPEVRLHKRKVEKLERSYWKKYYEDQINSHKESHMKEYRENVKLRQEISTLKNCVKLLEKYEEEKEEE